MSDLFDPTKPQLLTSASEPGLWSKLNNSDKAVSSLLALKLEEETAFYQTES